MKRLKTQFILAACIRINGSNHKRLRKWRNRSFTCIYDFEDIPDSHLWKPCLRRVGGGAGTFVQNLGIRLMIDDMQDFDRLVADNLSLKVGTIILAMAQQQIASTMIDHARRIAERVFVEVYTEDMVTQSQPFKPDGFVIRGNEAGGICSNMSNPAMLRKIREKTSLPIWIYGGIGLQSALAYAIGGANGVILSDCLLLIDELADDLKEQDRRALNTGIRTQAVDIGNGLHLRIGESYPELIKRMKALCAAHDRAQFERRNRTDTRLSDVLDVMKRYRTTASCFMGEEAAWAAEFGRRFATIPDVMQALKRVMLDHHDVLSRNYPLVRGNALAKELKTEFPIMQGPMTHVSDAPDFLARVAENGAVPFAALALNKGETLEALMRETQTKVGGKSWGVGLLGFAPKTLLEEQIALIEKYRPDIAIVAGGRPAHYQTLQRIGTLPFLHIPVPSMIPTFFNEGVRHFIFEGRGCGGHIGPINSFTLWQSALIAFQQLAAEGEDLSDVRIAFAGGIYDALSAAMTSAFCVPLLEQGVQFGFIVGTAYLFTREIRESAAITPAFQQVALESGHTAILETRAGHAIRCAPTALTSAYYREKADLLSQAVAPAEVHERLEKIYIGRLRLAAKGVKRAKVSNGDEELVTVNETEQMKEGLFMIGEAAALLDHVMGMADLHRSLCSDAVQALRDSHPRFFFSKTSAKPTVEARPTDIAVIGMSILAPGSDNLDRFWHNILAQLCCIGEVPEERWQPSVNFHPDPDNPDTTYSTKGGFLADIPINCMEYGIPPGSVPHIDPTQLLALEAVKQALIDAGYDKKEFDRTRTSVLFGFAGGGDLLLAYTVRAALKEYLYRAADIPDAIRERVIQSLNEVLPEWSEDSFPGVLGNVISGRVANRFNLNGLNFTVDAACASSMAALQVACQELAYGATQTAIVGGVDVSQHMLGYMCFSKSKALSRNGRSKPFSPEADGIVLGEGIGIVVLKRLADAIDDADRIYAVIKGIGGASDGKGSGMTVPLSRGQKLAIDRACEVAGFTTDTVDMFEAHGTGTPLGDRVELETIHNVRQNHGATQPCAIGSIKAAIGHTKGAAGIIGVIKATLALHHKVLPAQVNADTIHPAVSGPQTQLYLNTKTRPWFCKTAQHCRRAGVSAFGFGGTNFHTVLEEYDAGAIDPAELPRCLWPAELFLIGAPNIPSLINHINAAIDFMDQMDNTDASLTGFAYRHYLRHMPSAAMPVRFAVKAHSLEELRKKLDQSKQLMANGALQPGTQDAKNALRMADGIWGSLVEEPVGPLTALFPGQGSQLHMLRELAVAFPMVRQCLEHANAVLADEFFSIDHGVLTDYIYPPNHENAEEKKQAQSALTQTQIAQPALAAVEMALVYLLAQFNVQTAMAAGHSCGELTALWSAGVMTDRQLLTLASRRGRCMAAASKISTGMVAVHIDRNALSEFVDTVPELTIANHNTPEQVVVSGSMDALERLKVHCRQQKWGYTRLPVSQGFHSPHMAHAAAQWHHDLSSQQFYPPHFPVYANMTAKPYGRSVADIAGILKHHLQNGVAFVEQIEAMHADGARTFLEIGPGSTLINFISAILTDKPHHAIAVQPREDASGIDMLLDCLAALHACGYPVDLRPAYACRKIKTEEKTNRRPSATLFLVNGGRAKPTVKLKARKKKKANPSDWESISQFSSSPSRTASNPHTATEPSLVTTALQSGPARGKADSGHPTPSTCQRSAAGDKAYAPAAAQSLINHQERVQQLKHFQKSMSQFLETQERFQRKRLEMMEKMWNVNQQLVQNWLESAHSITMSASTDMGSEKETGSDTLNDRAFSDAAEAPAGRALSNSENLASQTPAALPKIDTGRDDSFRPSENSVQTTSVDYRSLLFDVISERTQYPVEMLALEQDIEADLGIDSIKRVEIISMLRETHPSLSDIADEKYYEEMAQLRTLGDVVVWIEDTFGMPGAHERKPSELPAEKTARDRKAILPVGKVNESKGGNDALERGDVSEISTDVESTETSVFRRYGLKLIEQPLEADQPRSLPGALMLLDGGHPLGRQIQSDAEKQGIRCVRVMHYANGNVENQDSIHLNARQEQDYETCYHRLKTDYGTPCGVLNLLSLGKPSHEECYQALIHSFLWAKTMGADPDLRQDKRWNLFWASVTGMGGDFGLNQAMDFEATQNGLHGITKCLYHEWPGLQAKTIDIHPEENTEQLSRFVLDECFATHDTITEIGFPNQTRHTLALTDLPHDLGDTQPRLNSDSVLLITGGAKGIASEAAVLLAKLYHPTMILVGRTPLPERSPDELEAFISRAKMGEHDPKELKSRIIKELMSSTEHVAPALVNDRYEAIMKEYKIRQNIEKMEQLHAKVFYHACDCTDEHDFSRLIRQTYKRFQQIDGVIHAAGCLKDAFITQKTTEHFKQVMDTKAKGARILLRELDFETLDFLMFFSSVSGRFGNRGQADYAAANEILNKMAVKIHHQWPGKAVAVNWGPWEGDGMVSSQLKEQFMKAGVYLLPRDLGAKMFNREINAVHRVSEVVIFGAADIEDRLPIVGRQTLSADGGQPLPFVQLFKMKNQPAGNSFCWQLDLDQSAPYLNDHRIDKVPVLAAAMAMEIMAQAGLAAGPAYRFKGIKKFDLYKGIMAESDHPLTLTIKADMHQNGSPADLIADVHLTLPNQINRSNYTCQVLLGKTGNDPVPALMHFRHSQRFRHSVEKIYENRLFHKGVFRALKSIESFEISDLKNSGIKGIIEPSTPERVIGDGIGGLWLIDPVVFDCAYQLALLWVQERYSTMALPSSIKRYRRYRSYNGGPIHCEVAMKNTQFPRLLMDFIFTDERGDLYAKATDVAALISRGLNKRLSARQSKLATIHS